MVYVAYRSARTKFSKKQTKLKTSLMALVEHRPMNRRSELDSRSGYILG